MRPTDPVQPMTALRYMHSPGRVNSLAQYVEGGGSLWLLGSGGGLASMISWNRTGNDQPTITFSNLYGELVEGRFMYDFAHWRSEFRGRNQPRTATAGAVPDRAAGRAQLLDAPGCDRAEESDDCSAPAPAQQPVRLLPLGAAAGF